ncbi:uncharacterized protein LOC144124952 [Amblyomma americanum]
MAGERKKINFTEDERRILIDLVDRRKSVIENKRTDAVSVNEKKVGLEIEQQFNPILNPSSFTWGGGSAVPSSLTEELEGVGAVASHMSEVIDNPFDGDRPRQEGANAASADECRAAVAGLLAPMQTQAITAASVALNGNEGVDELLQFIYEGDTEVMPPESTYQLPPPPPRH